MKFPQLARPPHGWREILWEILIVTVGVFIALATQQWSENRSWASKAQAATVALKTEIGEHYTWSVEWRMVEPCLVAQLDLLQQRMLSSGDRLNVAPVYSEPEIPSYVIRQPYKEYNSTVWQAIISDGVSPHLDPGLRQQLEDHYGKVQQLTEFTGSNQADQDQILMFSVPLSLDPSIRFSLLKTLNELRGRTKFMSLVSGQLIDDVVRERMVPSPNATRERISQYGTVKFCRAHGFPTRSFSEAMVPVPN